MREFVNQEVLKNVVNNLLDSTSATRMFFTNGRKLYVAKTISNSSSSIYEIVEPRELLKIIDTNKGILLGKYNDVSNYLWTDESVSALYNTLINGLMFESHINVSRLPKTDSGFLIGIGTNVYEISSEYKKEITFTLINKDDLYKHKKCPSLNINTKDVESVINVLSDAFHRIIGHIDAYKKDATDEELSIDLNPINILRNYIKHSFGYIYNDRITETDIMDEDLDNYMNDYLYERYNNEDVDIENIFD